MHGVLAAETTILVHLDAIRSILLVLHRVVVSLLAFVASQGDFHSCACSHIFRHLLVKFDLLRGHASLFGDQVLCGKTEKFRVSFCVPEGLQKDA